MALLDVNTAKKVKKKTPEKYPCKKWVSKARTGRDQSWAQKLVHWIYFRLVLSSIAVNCHYVCAYLEL